MVLHIKKLCVGCESIADLESWIEENRLQHARMGREFRPMHTTRMAPKRADEVLDGGSLYWIIKGKMRARQRIVALEPFTDADGVSRTHIVLDAQVVPVRSKPARPFQGWRYLEPREAPPDLHSGAGEELPENIRAELAALGLL